jgi:tripartite-type tricarboxylate transporter receptor subunit TctC
MKQTERFLMTGLVLMLALGLFWGKAEAQQYPTKAIDVIVPWNAGSSTDLVPRVIAPKLSHDFKVPINVVNKPGGSGITGTLDALRAKPDGYTMHSDGVPVSVHIGAWKDLPYDPTDRTFIARAAVLPFTIVVRADAPWKTISDVEQAIRKNPAAFRWSWLGGGGGVDIVTVQLKAEFTKRGVDLSQTKTVTFTGTAAVLPALGGGHVDIGVGSPAVVGPMVSAGKARVIAISGAERYKGYSDVPSAAEQGYPGVTLGYWVGFFGPPKLPSQIVDKWQAAVKATVADPELGPKWDSLGAVPSFLGGDAFKTFVLKEAEAIRIVMKQ